MGYETIVASIPGPYPGIGEADLVSYTDITDCEGICSAAREFGVRAVATCCLETGLRALACTCERLGLPGLSPEAAEISVDKLAMHRALEARGVNAPLYRRISTQEELDAAAEALGFPLVVKAPDQQGSRGVYVTHDLPEAHQALELALSVTGAGYCLAEEFIPGENLGAEAFVQHGEVLFVLPDGTLSCRSHANIPIGHYIPLDQPEPVRDRIRAEVRRAIQACGFDDCAVNVDLVLRGDEPYIIELTARAGATCLPELVSIWYGLDYYRMILMAALGEDVRPYFAGRRARPQPCAASMLSAPETGVLRSVSLPDSLPAYVQDLQLIVKPGDRVHRFQDSIDRIGQVIVTGDDAAACLRRTEDIISQIQIEVQP